MGRSVRLSWVGGEHDFALRLGELRGLQDQTNAGPHELLTKLQVGTWRVDDPIRTIQFGLVGGGMDRIEAGKLVIAMAELHGLSSLVPLSIGILGSALAGVAGDEVGEPMGVGPTSQSENGGSASSTDLGPLPDSPLTRSTE
ncbi:gene transfer agent family protein [Tabrizicola sp. M-4]|uniref:gene transfer agent family protein n=1 Tax=Tabrizicola sp. M-4 TaxID=3055847 RepID=UPI003DA8A893